MTVQEHYDYLDGEFDGEVTVNSIKHGEIELDLGDGSSISNLTTTSQNVVETLKELGYTPTSEPVVMPGYRGAHNQALLMTIKVDEQPYEHGIEHVQ